jgi:hypothetical protein
MVVEPGDPFDHRQFDGFPGLPWCSGMIELGLRQFDGFPGLPWCSGMIELGLAQAIDRFGLRVVAAAPLLPTERATLRAY